ncbi:MAG: biopolymer transporter ExbD [Pirellulaceae bacterium]|nr:biopolymer transporter ExbD [Pirellulaceae bacterium]
MTIKIRCPECGATNAIHQRVLGREVRCPQCAVPLQVPTQEAVETLRSQRAQQRIFEDKLKQILGKLGGRQPVALQSTQPLDLERFLQSGGLEQSLDERSEHELAAAKVSFSRPQTGDAAEMDMTPMVDVTFLLLIFFMITASFVVQKSIQRPAEREQQASLNSQPQVDDDQDSVRVQVDEFNAYNVVYGSVDTAASSKQDLIVVLNRAHGSAAPGAQASKLIIEAHENCIHAAVIAALDAGREAQFENFQVLTVEQFD